MTTTTLRPDGTIDLGLWTVSAGTAHAALSDDSDTTYVQTTSATVGDPLSLNMGTFTLPAGAVIKETRTRVRARTGTAGDFQSYVDAVLIRPSGNNGEEARVQATGVITTASSPYTSWQIPSTQAAIDALKVEIEGIFATSADGFTRAYEVYADIVTVPIPVTVVAAVTPDPYTASNIVPIAWTNTLDADGGVQTRYQIRVFTAAQYGIGGFNPATSPATQDTGEVIGGALTRNTAVLANSTTYRAYVRVAQTVNGVSHWSAYAFDQFAVSVTTSDILSVTTVAVNASARIDVTVNRNGATSAWNFVEVERSTDAGVTWSPVRGATYVDATGNANTFTVSDYETANGQATLYRARATRIVSLLPISGAFVQSTPSVSWSSTSAWLKAPSNPTRNSPVDIDTPFVSTELPVRAGVFDIIGSAERVVISDVMSSPGSTLVIRTEPSDTTLIALLRDLVLLYHPTVCEGGTTGRYISITGVTFTPTVINGHVYQLWTVPYVEIATPRDPLASAP